MTICPSCRQNHDETTYAHCPTCLSDEPVEDDEPSHLQVVVTFKMIIDSDRDLDLANPHRWNAVYSEPKIDRLIYDIEFKGEHEMSFQPVIEISKRPEQTNVPSSLTAIHELLLLVGIEEPRRALDELESHVILGSERKRFRLPSEPVRPHMVFTGNPGTGKTTVARLFAKRFKEIGLLPIGHLIEADRSSLVGEYVGHTAAKTLEVCESALGGVLFIDEAYSLANDYKQDFGHEAITTLLKFMEDHKGELVVIVAGYADEMKDFITSNPGLESRFDRTVHFRDYSDTELLEILTGLAGRKGYDLSNAVVEQVRLRLIDERADTSFANARTVRKILDSAILRHSARISTIAERTIETHRSLQVEDFTP